MVVHCKLINIDCNAYVRDSRFISQYSYHSSAKDQLKLNLVNHYMYMYFKCTIYDCEQVAETKSNNYDSWYMVSKN